MEEEGDQVIPWTGDRKVRVLWAIPWDGGEKKRKKVEMKGIGVKFQLQKDDFCDGQI